MFEPFDPLKSLEKHLGGFDFNSRVPFYNDSSDYTTNAPSYYDDLARKNKLIKHLALRIWDYDKEMAKRFAAWDKNLEEFPDEVLRLLKEWMDDGTFHEIINEHIFGELNEKIDSIGRRMTTQPIELYVDVNTGSDLNSGKKGQPLKLISTALKKLPQIINHEVVINVANGVYVENHMLDEWGRIVSIDTSHLHLAPERNRLNATYPEGRTWALNTKGGKLSIIGESRDGVKIRGRNPEETFDINTHARSGLKSRQRDLYIQNLTFEYYHTGITAHEGGAISGHDIVIQECSNVMLMAESMQAKIEIGGMIIRGDASYCILNHNGQIGLNDGSIEYDGNAPMLLAHNGYNLIARMSMTRNDGTGVAITNDSGYTRVDDCTLDKVYLNNTGGTLQVLGGVIKNVHKAVRNQGGRATVGGGINIFNCDYGVSVEGGSVGLSNIGSMEGTTQRYNREYGVIVERGNIDVSPYSYTHRGYNLQGSSLKGTKDIFFNQFYPMENFSKINVAYSPGDTGWRAGALGGQLNQFLSLTRNPDPITNVTTLYPTFRTISTLTAFNVQDSANQLNRFIDHIIENGYASSEFFTDVRPSNVQNTEVSHDDVMNKFNLFLQKLGELGLMRR